MKKVITFIIMFIFIFSALSVVAFAESGATENVKSALDGILDRLFEWWEANKAEILAALSGVGAVVCAVVNRCTDIGEGIVHFRRIAQEVDGAGPSAKLEALGTAVKAETGDLSPVIPDKG